MKISWQKFDGVEAQVFEPDAGASAVILFCPGFPGMGATIFEQRHAGALTGKGFAVWVIKHKGTKLSGGAAPAMVNNSGRLYEGGSHIGSGPATIDDWMREPFKALKEINAKYDSIHVIGNSFGALSALWSMTEKDAAIGKVKSLLLYAGAQGVDNGDPECVMRVWKPEFIRLPRITDKVELNDVEEVVSILARTYKELPERVKAFPENIKITYLVVEKDEILRLSDTEAFMAAIGGRGTIVMDSVDHAWPDQGLFAHDTPNYKTDDLLKLIRG